MKENYLIQGEELDAPEKGALEVELYLKENYLFRRNVLNGKVEFAAKQKGEGAPLWKALTRSALNSIIIRAKREHICEKGGPKTDIVEYVNSDEIDVYNPIADYLTALPAWDGQNHVGKLFERLLEVISRRYPSVKSTHSTRVYLGRAMKALGFESTDCGHVAHYKVVPIKAA